MSPIAGNFIRDEKTTLDLPSKLNLDRRGGGGGGANFQKIISKVKYETMRKMLFEVGLRADVSIEGRKTIPKSCEDKCEWFF